MNKFWGGSSSEEEDERSQASESSEDQPVPQLPKQTDRKFALAFDESDSESEDERREVKSQKDRTWDTLREGITKIKNARKNNDWPLIQDEFNNVNKQIEKSKMMILQHGLPNFYIKMLMEVEDHVLSALKDKEAIKKMKPVVERALNQMKLQVRKHNEQYRAQINDCREHPEKYEEAVEEPVSKKKAAASSDSDSDDSDESSDDSSSESESESEDEKPQAKTKPVATKPAAKAATFKFEDEEDSSEDELAGVEDESSSSEDERRELTGRARWLKKKPTKAEEDKKKDKKKEQKVVVKKAVVIQEEKKEVKKRVEEKLTEEELDKRIADLISARGRKGTDIRDVTRQLEVLTKLARLLGPAKEIPVIMHYLSAMFDAQRGIDDYMDHNQWYTAYRALQRILSILETNPSIAIEAAGTEELVDLTSNFSKIDVNNKKLEETESKKSIIRVTGNIESFVLRLEDEYNKSLQQINPHTQEYVIRLANEAALVELEETALRYYERVQDTKAAASIALFIVEHLYYKHDNHAAAVQQAHAFNKRWGSYADLHPACKGKIGVNLSQDVTMVHPASFAGNPTTTTTPINYAERLEELCNYIFKYGDDRMRTRAVLCSVYHHALHERYYVARDLFLMSHIQDYIDRAEVRTQILFNRTLVMLGLCAFRNGLYSKAHDCLQVICAGRVKELLAQGSSRSPDKDPEQERIERRRQMPYHMHINPDLLESCHLISAMILELPLLARVQHHPTTGNQIYVSRHLRKYLDMYSKQTFSGPPETVREHIVASTRAILRGDWASAKKFIRSLEVWNLLPANGGERVKDMLEVRIREEAIRCYILSNHENYDSISLPLLCAMFEMSHSEVRKILCHMIFNKEIAASLETNVANNATILVFYKVEPSTLQQQCTQAAEKLSQLLESNERIVDSLIGVYGYKDDWNVKNKQTGGENAQGGAQVGSYNNSGFNKRKGVRSSRPVVAKGTRMATSGRHSSRAGTSTGHQSNRNVWQGNNRNNNNNNNNRRQNNNNRSNNNSNKDGYRGESGQNGEKQGPDSE